MDAVRGRTNRVRLVFHGVRLIFETLILKHVGAVIHRIRRCVGLVPDGIGSVIALAASRYRDQACCHQDRLRKSVHLFLQETPCSG